MTMDAGNHRALLIGLGKQQDKTWGVIHGDRDVVYMEKMLKDAGYKDIISLKNEKATKEAIVRQQPSSTLHSAMPLQPSAMLRHRTASRLSMVLTAHRSLS